MPTPFELGRQDKITEELQSRLRRLAPSQRLEAVVLLDLGDVPPAGRRASQADRLDAVATLQQSAISALSDVDRILNQTGGERLGAEVNALGAIPILATAATLWKLAESEHVRGILENQPASFLH